MMLRVLRDRFVWLAKGEDGAALVVTLAVFFFIYLLCMGVYAVGTNVRERIHLQNACDAAAYSAAVVQADTLSRIATINRAMSWTYVQMTRRQMDYIVNRWLDRTVSKYKQDMATARSRGSSGRHGHDYWDIEPDGKVLGLRYGRGHRSPGRNDRVRLNDSKNVRIDRIEQENKTFLRTKTTGASFYAAGLTGDGLSRLRTQITADKNAISDMNAAEEKLSSDMAAHIEDAVREILRANLGEAGDQAIYNLVVPSPCLKVPEAKDDEEGRFLLWSDPKGHSGGASDVFQAGHDTWFHLEDGGVGFLRRYDQTGSALKAAWHWQSATWTCPPRQACVWVITGGSQTSVLGSDVSDRYFVGERAMPLILQSEYFGADGTISVGLAKKTENPFVRFLGSVTSGGIYSAFNPFGTWMVALASAKAGYAHNIPDDGGRKYWISYKQHWKNTSEPLNLSQSNWDAVFVPVRMAGVNADGREWPRPGSGNLKPQWHAEKVSNHIQAWMTGGWKYVSSDNASSENPSMANAGGMVDLRADQDKMDRESDAFWTEWDGDLSHVANDAAHPVRAKWQIGNPGKRVDWDQLSERIFH